MPLKTSEDKKKAQKCTLFIKQSLGNGQTNSSKSGYMNKNGHSFNNC